MKVIGKLFPKKEEEHCSDDIPMENSRHKELASTGMSAIAGHVIEVQKEFLEYIAVTPTNVGVNNPETLNSNELFIESYKGLLKSTVERIQEEIEGL